MRFVLPVVTLFGFAANRLDCICPGKSLTVKRITGERRLRVAEVDSCLRNQETQQQVTKPVPVYVLHFVAIHPSTIGAKLHGRNIDLRRWIEGRRSVGIGQDSDPDATSRSRIDNGVRVAGVDVDLDERRPKAVTGCRNKPWLKDRLG